MKVKDGDTLECLMPASFAYHKGGEYTVYSNSSGVKCILGDDGFEDVISNLLSKFKVVDEPKAPTKKG